MGHDHHHDHDHGHGGHHHAIGADADRRWLTIALAIVVTFMVVEVVAGLVADSLALLSDAAHMATDAAAIALALVAADLARRPVTGRFTFGLKRAEILSAQVNGVALLVLAGVVLFEGVRRLGDPRDVDGVVVIVVGVVGAVANVATAAALARAERQSLNVEGARQHVLADLYGSIAAVAGGIVVVATGSGAFDAIAAVVVAALMLRSGWRLVRDSGRVLLEGTPAGLDAGTIGRAMAAHPGVVEVHDLHVWEVTSGFPALAAHVTVGHDQDCHGRRRELDALLHDRFGIDHTTLQLEHEPVPALLSIERR
jgi:cobalt-zinc-cadmium efflux system protein